MDSKKKVYLIQPNSRTGSTISFPYAVGVLAAYALRIPKIRDAYIFSDLLYKKDPYDEVLENLDNPFLVGFSNYMWNCDYNLGLADKIKQRFPACILVFGGHHIPNNTAYLEQYPFLDILVHGEGEEVFARILCALADDTSLSEIPNISLRTDNGIIQKTEQKSLPLLDSPSPYLDGLFDALMAKKEDSVHFDAIIETNRGCPYHCAYCCWVAPKVRLLPAEKIFREIAWLSENKIEYCFCADANFGMYERDESFVDAVVAAKTKNGFPEKFEVACIEGNQDFVFRINKKLNDAGLSKGATIPFQSFSETALSNVGRKRHADKEGIASLLARYRHAGIPTYSDFILGFPGETYESFTRGLCEALELGQHNSINVHVCEVLPNAMMAEDEYIQKFGIKTVTSSLSQPHCEGGTENDMSGRSRIVVETSTMSRADWKRACRFSACLVGMHNYGLLACFAIFLHNEKAVSYYDFYTALLSWIETGDNLCTRVLNAVTESIDNFLAGNGKLLYRDDTFGNLYWTFEEGFFINLAHHAEAFYAEIPAFLHRFDIEEDLFEQLLNYQKALMVLPGRKSVSVTSDYDFLEYFSKALDNDVEPLNKRKNTIVFRDSQVPEDWCSYGIRYVWYGKRDSKTIYTSNPAHVEVKYSQTNN